MPSRRIADEEHPGEVDEMNTDERLSKLEAKVDHIQSDVTEVKTDTRQLREAMQGTEMREAMHALGKELRKAQRYVLR
jgi:predicted  nucleic acid-binding Zn-ribbon protein